MIIISIIAIIILTNLVGVVHFWNASEITFCIYFLNSSSLYIVQYTSAWWLVHIFGSFWVMLYQETKGVICIPAYPPPSSFSLSLLFLLRSARFFKAHLVFWGFPHPQIYYLLLYKKCVLGNKSLLEKDRCS